MIQTIPLLAIANQKLSVTLNGQDVDLAFRQLTTGLYADISLGGKAIAVGTACLDRVKLVRHKYLGLKGDLYFVDTQGKEDPQHTGLGARWTLVYDSEA
ncbi:hypothetical protein [uncultured Pseudacidovorax sp.]|uniref:phage baseplate plug family protein n=1 Tax=uncultured Pseudacidovorax sp. TaxID=679313 RepID=UPI0025D4F38A|nr:hypothetical protein [uncultured Pseudacidovorax sp.]